MERLAEHFARWAFCASPMRLALLWPLCAAIALGRAQAQDEPACASELSAGFSAVPIDSGVPFDGTVGAGGDGELLVAVREPAATWETYVFVNVVSQLEAPRGVQGWSFGIAFDGDAELFSAEDLFADAGICLEPPPCPRTKPRIVDPAENQGQRGVISVQVLNLIDSTRLPSAGTQSLLKIGVRWTGPLPSGGGLATLRFLDGLRGSGQPVINAFTVEGATLRACNFDRASVRVRLIERHSDAFVRGDANQDGKVNMADAIWILNELFAGGPQSTCKDAADMNRDGLLGIADPVYLLRYEFLGGDPPPAPFPVCGVDPSGTAEPLGCEEQTHCA